MERFGIENLQKVVLFTAGLAMAMDRSFADGRFTFNDTLNFVTPIAAIPATPEQWKAVKDELLDLSEAESEQLHTYVAEQLSLSNDGIEELVEDSLELGLHNWAFINKHFISKRAAKLLPARVSVAEKVERSKAAA